MLDISTNSRIGGTEAGAGNTILNSRFNAVSIVFPADGGLVQGNNLGPNPGNGISTFRPNHTIGGTTPAAGNVITGNGSNFGSAINLNFGTTNALVQGNIIGLGLNGVDPQPNANGVLISSGATNNTIGGAIDGGRNVISANTAISGGIGVLLDGNGNFVLGNYIGTDVTGNLDRIGGNNNSILGNVISGNEGFVAVEATDGTGNKVQGNFIGTDITGLNAIPNANNGVAANIVGGLMPGQGNRIAFNGGVGVFKLGGEFILGNSIFNNGGFGITHTTFGVNTFPVITQAMTTGDSTNIQGTLNSQASTTYRIEFFANDVCNAPAPNDFGEGQSFIGSTNVTTNANGTATFNSTSTTAICR